MTLEWNWHKNVNVMCQKREHGAFMSRLKNRLKPVFLPKKILLIVLDQNQIQAYHKCYNHILNFGVIKHRISNFCSEI